MRRRPPYPSEEESSEEPLINLTPLIDVVFVVLISFILIAPILQIDSISLAPGSKSSSKNSSQKQNHTLCLSIRSDNSIWTGGKQMNKSELQAYLAKEKLLRPELVPEIAPDAHCHFETFCEVKNILELCGFAEADMILRPS